MCVRVLYIRNARDETREMCEVAALGVLHLISDHFEHAPRVFVVSRRRRRVGRAESME